jgi:hypothetical protein
MKYRKLVPRYKFSCIGRYIDSIRLIYLFPLKPVSLDL